MKILLVSHSVLPYKGGSSIIVENLVKNFDVDEMIVLGSRELKHPKVDDRKQFYYFFSELSIFGRGARFFNWFRKFRYQALKRRIQELIREEEVDYVIGVYPNSFYCKAACEVAVKENIPFSSYFHNTYVENTAIQEKNALANQKLIFEKSTYIFVMSKGMQSYYEEKYKLDKFIPLVHTFDTVPENSEFTPLEKKDEYKLVAIGNFNESNIEATQRLVNAISKSPKYSLSIYTHVPKVLLEQRGIKSEHIEHLGFINPDDIHSALQEFDICVLSHGFEGGYGEVEYRTIFPTRTIPFLLSGKPIFAHSPPKSFLNHFLAEHKCAEVVDVKDEKAILEGLDRIVNNIDHQKKLFIAAKETVKMFYGPMVANFLKSKLESENKV